jgi:hypothetical protein
MILIVSLEGEKACLNFYQSSHSVQTKARELLAGLDKLLKKNKISPKDIHGILAFFGHLTFSASRQAAAVLNALAFVQKTKIVAFHDCPNKQTIEKGLKILTGRKVGGYIEPRYDRPPSITRPKN